MTHYQNFVCFFFLILARYAAAMKNGSKPALDTLIDLLDLAADVLRSCEEKSTSNNELLSRTCNASSSEIQIEQNFCEINVDEDCMSNLFTRSFSTSLYFENRLLTR